MSCFLCLSPLSSGVIRILECPDHWVHENCYIIPVNPAALRCPVCLKQGSSFANGFMYNQTPFPEQEVEEQDDKGNLDLISRTLEFPKKTTKSRPKSNCNSVSKSSGGEAGGGGARRDIYTFDVEVSNQMLLRKKATAARRRQGTRLRKRHQQALERYREKQTWTHLRQEDTLVGSNDVDGGPGLAIPSQIQATIKKEELDVRFPHDSVGSSDGSVTIGVITPFSTNEEIKVPQTKSKTWAQASDLLTTKRREGPKREHRKVCYLCNPPKVTGYAGDKELYQKHVLECHLGQDGVIACPYCPKTCSLVTLRVLLSHIQFVHLARQGKETCSDDPTVGTSSTSIPLNFKSVNPNIISPVTLNTRKRKSAKLKGPQKTADNFADPAPIRDCIETKESKQSPRPNWRKIKSQLSYRGSRIIKGVRRTQASLNYLRTSFYTSFYQ